MPGTIDLHDEQTLECPYPTYKTLRDEHPVYRLPGTDMYVLSRYADIVQVLSSPDDFRHGPAGEADVGHGDDGGSDQQTKDGLPIATYREGGEVILAPFHTDPPDHRSYRNLLDRHFSVRGCDKYRGLIEREIARRIDSWIDDGRLEFVEQFALPFPVTVITEILGFDLDHMERLHQWSSAWVMPFSGVLTPDQQAYVAQEMSDFRAHIKDVLARKRADPDESVISQLIRSAAAAPPGSPPTGDMQLASIIEMLFTGGNHTTTHGLTSMMWLVLTTPGMESALRSDRSLISGVVEEALRLESVVQGLYRHTARDVEISGVRIPKGTTLHIRFAAANRDERFFTEPDVLDPQRSNIRRHLGFGLGEHHCPGAALARLEMSAALDALLDRTRDWKLLPSQDMGLHLPGFVLRSLRELRFEFQTA
jgi:cytochrome P450